MTELKILKYPDDRLRQIAHPVKNIDGKIKQITKKMFDIMRKEGGIGLAATQVNIHQQIIVIDIPELNIKELVLINPVITSFSGKIEIEERCLSVPNYSIYVKRSRYLSVIFKNEEGNLFKIKTKDLLSVCIQHELDHLKGKLLLDYFYEKNFSKMKKTEMST